MRKHKCHHKESGYEEKIEEMHERMGKHHGNKNKGFFTFRGMKEVSFSKL